MRKTLLLLILIPAALLLGGYAYVRYSLQSSIRKGEKHTGDTAAIPDTLNGKKVSAADLRPLFIKRLQQIVKQSSNGLYDLSIGDLHVDVLAGSVVLQGMQLKPDSTTVDSLQQIHELPNDVFTAAFDSLRIEGINLGDAIDTKTMDYSLIRLVKPSITIHHKSEKVKKDIAGKEDFSQRFLKQMERLSIKKIVIEDGTVNLYNDNRKGAPAVLKHIAVHLANLQLDSTTRRDKSRLLFAESGTISFRDYSRRSADGLYTLKIGSATITAPQDSVLLTNFSFTSPYNRTQFSKHIKRSTELYNLNLPSIALTKVNWWELLNEEAVVADGLKTSGGRLYIFLDRSLPPRDRTGNFPNQLLMKLPIKLNIGRAAIQKLAFSYAEYNPLSKGTGTIYLDDVSLRVNNISNEQRLHPPPVVVSGTARFMHQVPAEAEFRFDMSHYKSGRFTTHIHMNGFDGSLINSFAEPMGMMKIEHGTLHGAEATVAGDEKQAHGVVALPYNDLKLSILKRDNKGLDKKDVTSLLANLIVLKKDNPTAGEPLRREAAQFTRMPEGSFFMLVWKTILVGTLKTIGAPTKIASKTVSSQTK